MGPPAEKSFVTHLLGLKEKLETGVIKSLTWDDTRDMTADGHTKDAISQNLLGQIAAGRLERKHPVEELRLYDLSLPRSATAGE